MSPNRKTLILVVALMALAAMALAGWGWYAVAGVDLRDLVFFLIAAVTVGCAAYAVMAPNIVRSVFSLLGTFFGMAGLYASLAADFLAVVQLMVYVGGILVLMLFAVMLTSRIERAGISNPFVPALNVGTAGVLAMLVLTVLVSLALLVPWPQVDPGPFAPTVERLGEQLLGPALFPFELLSVVLLAIVIGAVVIARQPGGEDTRAEPPSPKEER